MKFLLKNYGCQMNTNTGQRIARKLTACGFMQVDSDADADVIIFNTCCIRDTAEQKILSHIGKTGWQKRGNPKQIIAVIGCLSEKERDKLKQRRPYIDIIRGTADAESVVDELCGMFDLCQGVTAQPTDETAYIDITYGCENFCSYCIVPYVRGKLRMRPLDEIVAEFTAVKDTAKTIWLLGQNVNAYYDESTGTAFPKLLGLLAGMDGDFRLNFLSAHPKDFHEDTIKAIAENKKIMRDIHLPLQSGCDKILKLMNRKYTVAEYTAKIEMLRKYVPDVHITTDIICGFPNETEDDFNETAENIKKIKFNAAYIFPYSNRSGTLADKMDGQIPFAVRKQRASNLIAIMRQKEYID